MAGGGEETESLKDTGGGLEKCGMAVINWEAPELIGGAASAQQSALGWLDFHKNLIPIIQQEQGPTGGREGRQP